ncbi:hypothetical protein AVEN_7780-1, partial [Araneus ventricosus]
MKTTAELSVTENSGVAFTPWVTLPGVYAPDVLHPLLPETLPIREKPTV